MLETCHSGRKGVCLAAVIVRATCNICAPIVLGHSQRWRLFVGLPPILESPR